MALTDFICIMIVFTLCGQIWRVELLTVLKGDMYNLVNGQGLLVKQNITLCSMIQAEESFLMTKNYVDVFNI